MKAEVQYNDFIGTSAADISDYQTLEGFLKAKGVDTNRFNPIGVTFFTSNNMESVPFSIICIDKQGEPNQAVKISVENSKINDVISLFKRLDVIFTRENYKDYELIDEPILSI